MATTGAMGKNFGDSNVKKNQDFYCYAFSIEPINFGTSVTRTLQIEADSDFHSLKMTYLANIAAAALTDSTRVIPLIRIQVQDTGSGRNLFNQAVPIPTIMGTGELPFIIPLKQGRQFKSNSGITFTLTNYSAAVNYNIDVVLSGVKTWD